MRDAHTLPVRATLACGDKGVKFQAASRTIFSDGFERGGGFGNPNRVCCAGCFLNRLRALKAACIFELRQTVYYMTYAAAAGAESKK